MPLFAIIRIKGVFGVKSIFISWDYFLFLAGFRFGRHIYQSYDGIGGIRMFHKSHVISVVSWFVRSDLRSFLR